MQNNKLNSLRMFLASKEDFSKSFYRMLDLATKSGKTFIITNAAEGWV
jgi:hypothetical protein